MANTLITPQVMAREVMDHLYENTIAAGMVHRDYEGDFGGGKGSTVTVKRPAQFSVNEFNMATRAATPVQDATESSFTVSLDTMPDVSFAVTTEELTWDVEDFSRQFLAPAGEAIAQYLDAQVLALIDDAAVTQEATGTVAAGPDALIDAGKILNDNNVPTGGRKAILSTAVAAAFLKDSRYSNVDVSGETAGLRDASLGRKYGFDQYESTNLPAGDSALFHPSAFSLVTRTPAIPRGASSAAVINYKGFGLRVVQDYDLSAKQDVVSIDFFYGVKVLDGDRAVRLTDV